MRTFTAAPSVTRAWHRAEARFDSYVSPNARCPVCGALVFFYQSPTGGRVFFDELGPPWPKHPCTDNGVQLRTSYNNGVTSRRPSWISEGWVPLTEVSLGTKHGEWTEFKAKRADSGPPLTGLVPHFAALPSDVPILARRPGAHGLGRLAWLEHDGRPRDEALIAMPLAVVPHLQLELASQSDAAATEEVATLLFASLRDLDDAGWPARIAAADLALLREWLRRAAAAGSCSAARWLEEVGSFPPPAGELIGSPAPSPDDPRLALDTPTYKAYTRDFDEEVGAADLIPISEEGGLKDRLERAAWALLGTENSAFGGDADLHGTLVTLLLDCSGSLRGYPLQCVAALAAVLGDAIVRAGGSLDLLGFTTAAWKGGQSREKWISDGKPRNPGRLNDLRHVIFKGWDEPWEGTIDRLGLLLCESFLKENIDGEALAWAYRRALSAPALRRRMLVVTDGAPVDDSTLSANPGDYLERHLRDVIAAIEEAGHVHLAALGVNRELGALYRSSAVWRTEAGRDGLSLAWHLIVNSK
ncbi:cobaltochelatase CobT-related protein [Crenalkalicoccus roseus]|uniref:cobaltochelatase CobT-related protein n=1 Tax=Crenalkalicoccus roseus TaxID=1485588 RepID=UPI0013053BA2|nr:hypothetical protein [Crenalkalicoccus roseus]